MVFVKQVGSSCYELWLTGKGFAIQTPAPAGPRLFRGGDWPSIQFKHNEQTTAEKDAQKLEAYLMANPKLDRRKKGRKSVPDAGNAFD